MTISRCESAGEAIRIVAGIVMNDVGETLLVRKAGTSTYMQPGGKSELGEAPLDTLARELREELGCGYLTDAVRDFGEYSAAAANEPGRTIVAQLFGVRLDGEPGAGAEIDSAIWVDPATAPTVPLAPLTRDSALPIASQLALEMRL